MEKQNQIIVASYDAIQKIIEQSMQKSIPEIVQLLKKQLEESQEQAKHPLLIKKKEAQEILGVNYRTLQKLINQGAIKAAPDGKKVVYKSLIDYVNGQGIKNNNF